MKKKLVLFLILALFLTQMPLVGTYFSIVNTLLHETGHALMSIITGGNVQSISLFSNTEGVTLASHRYWFGGFLTSAAGYVFASFMAFLFMTLIYKRKSNYVLVIILGILLISLLFWIRNAYGLFWIITIIIVFSWVLVKGSKSIIDYSALFITSLLLVESVTSSFEIMYISLVSPSRAGDATNLANMTVLIPTMVWGVIFFLQSLFFARLGLKRYF
ncbi:MULTISPECIES: M50 family metallopeptidase [Paraliobacillus]|uniref:M50 family metallopeptidase n=1 Tax=Paraliobacillus TaxID=200903 RepID=UPI000DD33964|nr:MULTISPECIES: M50 family metallopeptidase [Paraliobacillus]